MPFLPISVVIPIARGDLAWQGLLGLFASRELGEIVLSVSEDADKREQELYHAASKAYPQLKLVQGSSGRGRQINRAIAAASSRWIWVLHADSRFAPCLWPALEEALQRFPERLHFFALRFAGQDPRLALNEWGVVWRSRVMGMPFGDQGFLFEKSKWQALGGFSESCAYGEDHLFVWHWRQRGFKIHGISAAIETSPRKYESYGWWQTTFKHGWLTWKQALPEIYTLWQRKLRRRG